MWYSIVSPGRTGLRNLALSMVRKKTECGVVEEVAATRSGSPKSVFFLTIDKAKFRKPVLPGDTIEYHMQKIAQRKTMWWYRGEAKVAGQIVAEAEVGAMLTDA